MVNIPVRVGLVLCIVGPDEDGAELVMAVPVRECIGSHFGAPKVGLVDSSDSEMVQEW